MIKLQISYVKSFNTCNAMVDKLWLITPGRILFRIRFPFIPSIVVYKNCNDN